MHRSPALLLLACLSLLACDVSTTPVAGAPSGETHAAASDLAPAHVEPVADETPVADEEPPADEAPVATVAVSGRVFIFSPQGGVLEGAEIFVLEHPELSTVTDAGGHWSFPEVPVGDATFVMLADGYPENQTGTFTLAEATGDLEWVAFQAVSDFIFDAFATIIGVEADPELCQVAATVTFDFEPFGYPPVPHGEPGATVTIEPALGAEHGPFYFNESVIPAPERVETSIDGGVAFTNVPPGEYVLEAHKDGVAFGPVVIKCRPGVLVNGAPPRGLQVLADE